MTNPGVTPEFGTGNGGVAEEDSTGPVVRDRRRLDPETGELRDPAAPAASERREIGIDNDTDAAAAEEVGGQRLDGLPSLEAMVVDSRHRVDGDVSAARTAGVADLCEALIPVMDAIELAREHGELEGGPFQGMAENLEPTLTKLGWERYGAAGEEFDPQVHEALMHESDEEASVATIKQVLQPGYRVEERVLRAARVAVVGP